jgi:hypothetical protein
MLEVSDDERRDIDPDYLKQMIIALAEHINFIEIQLAALQRILRRNGIEFTRELEAAPKDPQLVAQISPPWQNLIRSIDQEEYKEAVLRSIANLALRGPSN